MKIANVTKREAAEMWANEFDAIPESVLVKLQELSGYSDIEEITPPALYDRVDVFSEGEEGEIIDITDDGEYIVKLDNDETVTLENDNFEVLKEYGLPMWNTLWSFSDSCDINWAENHLQEIANCGFKIYQSEDYGIIIGIDGCGYDFYESHWIPLYNARGLHWHDVEEEE